MRIRQRRFLNVSENIGFVATVSLWALKVAGVSLAVLFHQDGISPHRIGSVNRASHPFQLSHQSSLWARCFSATASRRMWGEFSAAVGANAQGSSSNVQAPCAPRIFPGSVKELPEFWQVGAR